MTATDALRTSDDITDRLLTAAIEVFTERGIEKAGVALIARRAGLTTGAIYNRWEGKQELLLDALDVVLMQQIAQLLPQRRHRRRIPIREPVQRVQHRAYYCRR